MVAHDSDEAALSAVASDAVAAVASLASKNSIAIGVALDLLENTVVPGHTIHFIGMGKSAIVAQKMAASFRSFGFPATFIHAADATHGDIGIVDEHDAIVCVTHSGLTEEVVVAVDAIYARVDCNCRVIAIAGSEEAQTSLDADVVLTYNANDLLGVAPAASAVAQLVLGDALLLGLIKRLDVTLDDFKTNHPGGSLGRRLTN